MTKQKTDNLELITLDDVDRDAFYADYVENLGKINNADKARQAAIGAETGWMCIGSSRRSPSAKTGWCVMRAGSG